MAGRALILLIAVLATTAGTALGLDALGVARHWSALAGGGAGAAVAAFAGLFPPKSLRETTHAG